MKKLITLLTLFILSPVANSSGIPVIDVASLTQMVTDNTQRAAQWAKEAHQWAVANGLDADKLIQMKTQLTHYKSMVEGHYSFEDILYDSSLDDISGMDGWRELYDTVSDASNLRSEFGINSSDDSLDNQLRKYKLMEKFYERSVERNRKLKSLLGDFENADNPAKKADLANAIAIEQTNIKNDQQMINSLSKIQQHGDDIKHSVKSKRKIATLFGEGIPRH